MKKIAVICALVLLVSGCTKNYNTVEEYGTEMNKIKSANPSYYVEVTQSLKLGEINYKSYLKGEKWKTEAFLPGGSSYSRGLLYDGTDILVYSANSPYAITNPAMDMLKKQNDPKLAASAINSQNPVNILFNWNDKNDLLFGASGSSSEAKFVNNKDKKNGFDCRMVKFGENKEACISDKYGIAVYYKITIPNMRGQQGLDEVVFNVTKIDTKDLPDSSFELPEGVKKTDFNQMMNDISRKLNTFSTRR